MSQQYEERQYHSRDGLALYYRRYPAQDGVAASALLCLPGLTRNSRDFERLAPSLARTRTVLAPDLRGRGRSQYDPQWARYQPATYLDDVAALLAHEGLERVVVIGTSLGGLLAMMLAATRPNALSGVVLNDIGPEVDPAGVERISRYAGKLPAVTNWDEAVAQSREVYGGALPDLPDEEWRAFARRSYREDPNGRPVLDMDPMIGEAVRSAPNAAAPDLWPLWQALAAVPALAIRGAHSDILSSATFERMAQEKPDLLRVEVANRGHVPLLDEPAAITAIEAFLARVP